MTKGYEDPLRIASRRHDIVGVHLFDPREEVLPNVGLIRAVDAESGNMGWIDTSLKSVREGYSNWFQENFKYFQMTFRRSGVDSVSIKTDTSYVNALLKFFKKRSK